MKSRLTPSDDMVTLIKRFQYLPGSHENKSLVNDESIVGNVPEETLEAVDYERVRFNWPAQHLPQANPFAIEHMAIETLIENGYIREAELFKTFFQINRPAYKDLPNILYRFLDFTPYPTLTSEQKLKVAEAAQSLGVSVEAIKVNLEAEANPLAHKYKDFTISEEWGWLVSHEKTTTIYGKNAVHELSPALTKFLIEKWIKELMITKDLTHISTPNPTQVGDRAWFESAFPQGWSLNLDVFQESALISRLDNFENTIELMFWEELVHTKKGWDADSFRRLSVQHLNTLGINGAALIAEKAYDFLSIVLSPYSAYQNTNKVPQLVNWFVGCNPTLSTLPSSQVVWLMYRAMDPHAASQVESAYLTHLKEEDKRNKDSRQGLTNQHQSAVLTLEMLSLHEAAGIQIWDPQSFQSDEFKPTIKARL